MKHLLKYLPALTFTPLNAHPQMLISYCSFLANSHCCLELDQDFQFFSYISLES